MHYPHPIGKWLHISLFLAAVLLLPGRGHEAAVYAAAFSPDGKIVATGGNGFVACLWDIQTGRLLHVLPGHEKPRVTSVAFTPDGKTLATGCEDTYVRLWDVEIGKEIRRLAGHTGRVECLAFSADGKQLVSGSFDRTARLWEVASGKELKRFEDDSPVLSLSWYPGKNVFMTSDGNGSVCAWDVESGQDIGYYPGPEKETRGVACSPDGKWVAVGDRQGRVFIWPVASERAGITLNAHKGPVWDSAFSSDSKYLVTAGNDKVVRLWDALTGALIREFSGEGEGSVHLAVSPDGKSLVTEGMGNAPLSWNADRAYTRHDIMATQQSAPLLWDLTDGSMLHRFDGTLTAAGLASEPQLVVQTGHYHAGDGVAPVLTCSLSPDARLLITGGPDAYARIWDVQTGVEMRRFKDQIHGIHWVSYSPDGRYALSSSWGALWLWKPATGQAVKQLYGTNTMAIFSPAGDKILIAGEKTTTLQECPSGKVIRNFDHVANGVAFSPDVKWVLTGGQDKSARLWDVATGAELKRFEGFLTPIKNVAFAPGGERILVSDQKETRLLDVKNGQILWKVTGQAAPLPFSPDGNRVIVQRQETQILRAATGELLRSFKIPDTPIGFSPDGQMLLVRQRENAGLISAETGRDIHRFTSHALMNMRTVYSPDGAYIASSFNNGTACLWDCERNKIATWFTGQSGTIWDIAFSADGQQLVTASSNGTTFLWDCATGREIRRFDGAGEPAGHLALSSSGRYLAVGSDRSVVRLWDVQTGQLLYKWNGSQDIISALKFSPDGAYVVGASGRDRGVLHVWATASGTQIKTVPVNHWVHDIDFSPDGKNLAAGCHDGRIHLWSFPEMQATRSIPLNVAHLTCLKYSPDGTQILAGGFLPVLPLVDVATGKIVRQFVGHQQGLRSVDFSPSGKTIVSLGDDNMLRLWNRDTGEALCSLTYFTDKNWAVTSELGYYDSSNEGDVQGLMWVIGDTPVNLWQFKDGFYEPGLFTKKLGYNKEPLRAVPKLADLKLFPDIALAPPQNNRVALQLTAKNGGIGPVQVWINGKEWIEDARPKELAPNADTANITLTLESPLIKPGEENTLRVVARNAAANLASRPVEMKWQAPGTPEKFEPRLYAIVCGISQYANPSKIKNLRFADKDARDMAAALAIGAQKLFGTGKIEIRLFTGEGRSKRNANRQPALAATKANLQAAFEAVAQKARPQDVLVVYLAGHGTTLGLGSSVYCYPTQEADGTDFAAAAMAGKMITSDELAQWTKAIPAQKQVLILDTCASGAAGASLTEKRAVSGDQVRAIEKLKDRVGYHVLMGSAADAKSYEATRFNQGLLTYALLEGMKGPAREQSKGLLEVESWFAYARQQVPKLAGAVGGIQEPQIAVPTQKGKAQNFPVAQLDAATSREVPLSPGGILVVTPRIVDSEGEDALGLQAAVVKALEEATLGELNVGGQAIAGLTYVPTDELPGAWRMGGSYQVEGDRVTLQVTVRGAKENGADKGKSAEVKRTLTGRREDLAELAGQGVALLRNIALGVGPAGTTPAIFGTGSKISRPARQRWSGHQDRELNAAVDYFTGSALPAAGQLQLAGEVTDVDSTQRQITFSTHAFRLPNGKFQILPTPRTKTVRLPGNDTQQWQSGDEIVVVIPDGENNLPLALRVE